MEPQKKGLLNRITDAFKSSPDITSMKAEKQCIADETAQKQADLDRQIAKKESEIASDIRSKDPGVIAEQKRIEAIIKAKHEEARRLCVLNDMIDEAQRRHNVKTDDPRIDFYEAQITRESLWGVFGKGRE